MEKTATLNLQVNPTVKKCAKDILNANFMTTEEIHAMLREGFDELQAGKVQDAASAFAEFKESHQG